MPIPTNEPRSAALARRARETGLMCVLDAGPDAEGPASLGALEVTGRDAAQFLHVQVTNEVAGLEPGEGNLSARTARTGHLLHVFSLHRLPAAPGAGDGEAFVLLMERPAVPALRQRFEEFIFSEDVTLEDVSDRFTWVALQGPGAPAAAATAFGRLPEPGWDGLPPHAVRDLGAVDAPEGSRVFARSLTGDPGFVIAAPVGSTPATALIERLDAAAREHGLIRPETGALDDVLDVLRIEAGFPRVGPDTAGRDRLLPETGLEQQLVSYTKGCYLGQEVIARVRTYGSLPYALRGLVLDAPAERDCAPGSAILEELPPVGGDLVVEPDRVIGQIVSRALSPAMNAPVAFAYIDRAHRTPGTELRLVGRNGVIVARVALLPFHRASDLESRVAALYDRAVRVFASGDETAALAMMEEALRIDPAFADGYEAIGVMLGRSGRYHEAIDLFKRLEEVAPDEPIVNTNLSLYYMKLGDKQTAERESARALQKSMTKASSDDRSAADVAAEQASARRADAERKREMFHQVLEIDSEDPVALFGLGNALSTLEQWEEAERYLDRAAAVDGDNSAVLLARGKALEMLERRSEAVAVYRAGMEVASRKGDLMPLKEMENRLLLLAPGDRP
jgi:folate-binding protein YgfZ